MLGARERNYIGAALRDAESAARQEIAIKFLIGRKLEADRSILMPQLFRGNLALAAPRCLVAIRERCLGDDGCAIPDSRVRPPAVSPNHQTFADVIDAREFSRPLIGIEVDAGF